MRRVAGVRPQVVAHARRAANREQAWLYALRRDHVERVVRVRAALAADRAVAEQRERRALGRLFGLLSSIATIQDARR